MPRRAQPGASPGTLIVDPEAPKPVITMMSYGPDRFEERTLESLDPIKESLQKWPVTWINVEGLGDAHTIRKLGEIFGFHRLALEDVINVHQRAKVDEFGDHLYVVVRMVDNEERTRTEQLSVFLGTNYVLMFQEYPGDCFRAVRDRIRKKLGRIRTAGPDYLMYALLDTNLDSYFPYLEEVGENLETLEDEVLSNPKRETVSKIHNVKRELLSLRRAVWPQRDALQTLFRETHPLITRETQLYLRDGYDHVIQIIDLIETYRELGSDLIDIHLSSASNRMNEVMKLLTIISTIFIPLTFIVGLYGMNFRTNLSPWNMPELEWYWGYPFVWGVMLATTGIMLYIFRRRGWLGARPDSPASEPPPTSDDGRRRDGGGI